MKTLIKLTLIAALLLTGSFLPVVQAQSSLDNCFEVKDEIYQDIQVLIAMTEDWYAGEYNNAQDYWVLRDMRVKYETASCDSALPIVFAQYVAISQDIYIGLIIENDAQVSVSTNRSADLSEILVALLK